MKVWGVFAFLSAVAALSLAAPAPEDDARAKRQGAIAGAATAAAVAQVSAQVLQGLGTLFNKLNGPSNVKDVIVSGRGYRITIHDGTTATVMDKNTGLLVTKSSTTSEAAVNEATSELVKMLLQIGHISIHDLHVPPKDATLAPPLCKDKITNCRHYIDDGLCTPHGHFLDFMLEHCYYSCANCGQAAF